MSIYKPPSGLILNARDWFDFLDQFKDKILIGGDFNLQENFRMPLLESMVDLDLHVLLNSEEPIHFDLVHCKESSLDLTIISSDIALLARWRVSEDLWGSTTIPFSFLWNYQQRIIFAIEEEGNYTQLKQIGIGSDPTWMIC